MPASLDHASLDVLSNDGRLLKSYPVTSSGKVYVTSTVENVVRRFDLPFGGAPAIPTLSTRYLIGCSAVEHRWPRY